MNQTVRSPMTLEVDLHGAYIRRVVLRGAVLDRAILSGADSTGADFSSTLPRQAILLRTDFTNAN